MKDTNRLLLKRTFQFAFIFICGLLIIPKFLNPMVSNFCGVSLLKLHQNQNHGAQICLDDKSKVNDILLNSERGRMLLGYFYFGEELFEEAKLSFGLEQSSENPMYSYWMGRIHFEEGNLDEAIEYWRDNQPYAQSILRKANENLQSGDYHRAIELYEIVSQLIDDEPTLWLNYGKSLWNIRFSYSENYSIKKLRELDSNIKDAFSTSVSLDQADPESLDWLGWYYFKIEKDDLAALDLLQKASDHGGDVSPWVNFHLGRVYEKLGNEESALHHYQLAYDLRPENDVNVASSFSQYLAKIGKEVEAIDIVENILLVIDADNAAHYLRLVLYYSAICQSERAREYIIAAEGLNLDYHITLYNRAQDTLASPSPRCK